MDRINMAVGEQRGIELGGLFGVAIKPKARGNARHRDSPINSGGAGGLIDPLSFEHLRRPEGHAPRARLKARSRVRTSGRADRANLRWRGTMTALGAIEPSRDGGRSV